jgi:hypothetical protein
MIVAQRCEALSLVDFYFQDPILSYALDGKKNPMRLDT